MAGSPVPGILQARTLEWVAISFSNAWKWKGKLKSLSRVWLFVTPWTAAYQAPPSMGFSRQEYWSGLPMPSLNYHITVYIFWPTDTGDSCLFFPLIFETKRNVIGYHLNKILVPDMKLQRSKVNILFPPYWRNRVIIFSLGKMQTDNKKKWRVQVSLYISWIIVLFCWKNKDKEGVERRF